MTHNAVVQWGPQVITDEKRAEIEKAIKALIDALDRSTVESITFTNTQSDEEKNHENKEVGGTE